MIVQTLPVTHPIDLTAVPLTREAFAPFGSVLTNPSPASLPSATVDAAALPCGAAVANQGTAIQYRQLAATHDLYAAAPSRVPATPRTTMFVCRGRLDSSSGSSSGGGGGGGAEIELRVLERHPFTTQTFAPLSSDAAATRYLVVVAPSLAPGARDDGLPVPDGGGAAPGLALPGRGLPDLGGLRAFVATGRQAVTYGAGTWHAPMIALVRPDAAVDFVVVQFANGTAVEDCQEVVLEGSGPGDNRIHVRVLPEQLRLSRL